MKMIQKNGLCILVAAVIGFGAWSVRAKEMKTSIDSQNYVIPSTNTNPDLMSEFFQNTFGMNGFHKVDSIVGMTGKGALFACLKREIKADMRLDDGTFNELWDTKQIYHVNLGHQSDSSLAQTVVYFPYINEKHIGSTLLLFESGPFGEEIRLDDEIADLGLMDSLNSITSVEEKEDQLKIESTDGKHRLYTVLKWDGNIFRIIEPPKHY